MKKDITYYLEDKSRLSEISTEELNSWLEEMPYSHPLRLLYSMKAEQEGHTDDNTQFGAYFAEDYEPPVNHAHKTETISSKASSRFDDSNEQISEKEVVHAATDDTLEDIVEADVLEINPKTVLVNEIYHPEADEVLEDVVEEEVLEVLAEDSEIPEVKSDQIVPATAEIAVVKEIAHPNADDSLEELVEEEVLEVIDESSITSVEDENTVPENDLANVKYSDYTTKFAYEPKKGKKKKKAIKEVTKSKIKEGKKSKKKSKKEKINIAPISTEGIKLEMPDAAEDKGLEVKAIEIDEVTLPIPKKAKSSVKKKKKKAKAKKDSNAKKVKQSFSKKDKKSKSKKVKTITGNIAKDSKVVDKTPKSKNSKNKKVKYVVVESTEEKDFNLKDHSGVSKYTSWLLEQESVNGKEVSKKNKKSEKKDKKKKKKKKSKTLKIAAESVKKSDMIISEPLAKILAAQGHKKKAKKMYTQLGLIFPEKSSYFALQIENLKNK